MSIKMVKTSMQTCSDSFSHRLFANTKGPGTSFYTTVFVQTFYKTFSLEILHTLANFAYQTVFTSQVIQENAFLI